MSATLRLPLLPAGGKKKAAAARLTEIILHDTTVSRNETIPELLRKIIIRLGEDPNREGLRKTPERYEKALQFLKTSSFSVYASIICCPFSARRMSLICQASVYWG